MRSLLPSRDKRIILTLEYLTFNEWVSLKNITDYLGYSEKTVRNDLGFISSEFDDISVVSSPQLGYQLIKHSSAPLESIVSQVIDGTLIFQLLQLLLLNSSCKLAELESALFISANSIRNAVKSFNRYMKNDNLTIENRPFRLVGNEQKITSLFFVRMQQSYFNRDIGQEKPILQYIETLAKRLMADNKQLKQTFKDDPTTLTTLLYIRIYREKNNFSVPTKKVYYQQDYRLLYDEKISSRFFQLFEIELDKKLLNRLVNFILFEPVAINYLELLYHFSHTSDFNQIHQPLLYVTNQMRQKLALPQVTPNELITIIAPKAQAKGSENLQFDFDTHHFLLEILKYELAALFEKKHSYNQQPFFDNYLLVELAYKLQFHCLDLSSRLKEINQPMKVAVLLSSNKAHKQLTTEFLSYYFGKQLKYTLVSSLTDSQDYDLIITNTVDYPKDDIAVLKIASFPGDEHLEQLTKLTEAHSLTHYINNNSTK